MKKIDLEYPEADEMDPPRSLEVSRAAMVRWSGAKLASDGDFQDVSEADLPY